MNDFFRIFPELTESGLYLVDVGCSGKLDAKWQGLSSLLHYTGFDPDRTEIARLNSLPTRFKSNRFLPYAIAGQEGNATLYLTRSPFCNSLLRPRQEWLKRFSFHPLFHETGQTKVDCVTLDQLAIRENLRADILKLDTQGLEMPILRTAEKLLNTAFCVETETGFLENYHHESVAADVDKFMRQHGFLLFDMQLYRQGRGNPAAARSRRQPLWCECLWLKDYLAQESWDIPVSRPDRLEAAKALVICQTLGFADYGYELLAYFSSVGVLSAEEKERLSKPSFWGKVPGPWNEQIFQLVPRRLREWLYRGIGNTL